MSVNSSNSIKRKHNPNELELPPTKKSRQDEAIQKLVEEAYAYLAKAADYLNRRTDLNKDFYKREAFLKIEKALGMDPKNLDANLASLDYNAIFYEPAKFTETVSLAKRSTQNHRDILMKIANIYQNKGRENEYQEHLDLAAADDHPEALCQKGSAILENWKNFPDLEMGRTLMKQAIEKGYAPAQFSYGFFLDWSNEGNPEKLYWQAAESGNLLALDSLYSSAHFKAQSNCSDEVEESIVMFRRLSGLNHLGAKHALAVMLKDSTEPTEEELKEARRLLQEASDAGYSEARADLAAMVEKAEAEGIEALLNLENQ